jgi:hypothetical protein
VLATAHVTKAATSFSEVVANFIDLLDALLYFTNVLAAALITVPATALEVVVADLVKLLSGSGAVPGLPLLLAAFAAFAAFSTGGLGLADEARAIIVLAMKVAAAITIGTFARLLPVEALSTGRGLDWLTLGVLVVTLVAVAATACVAEGAAYCFGLSHLNNINNSTLGSLG